VTTELLIKKANGDLVPFHISKLESSLRSAGASESDIKQICSEIESELQNGDTTKAIYKRAFKLLKLRSEGSAGRYKLKRALMELGPSGYPFERYVAQMLKFQGYETRTGVFVEGKCISHEMDVVARNAEHVIYVECKFHNNPVTKSDLKVPLYVHSRFEDIIKKQNHGRHDNQECWIVTNTRFSEEAIKYASCAGIQLIGWDFPKRGSLKERIEISGLHPLTCMSSLSKKRKQQLLDKKVVLCRELIENRDILYQIGLKERKVNEVLHEADELCGR
jgi:Holliday junction resolvase-like predicted endonuclease